MKIENNYSLLRHNTFGIEARCSKFIEFENVDELQHVVCDISENNEPFLIIGGGSNLLLTEDYSGTVIHSAIKGCEISQTNNGAFVRCGSGDVWDDIVLHTISKGLFGMENLSLIPGEVGASAVQNIGAYGAEAKDLIYKVEAVEFKTGKIVEFDNSDCAYSYRQSIFKKEWRNKYVITYVTYKLSKNFKPNLNYGNISSKLAEMGIANPNALQLRNAIIDIRNSKLPDPKIEGNAGSFFMNPVVLTSKYKELAKKFENMPHYTIDPEHEKIPAGWMIDQCGWKGKSLGHAAVHDKQALVLVNKGGATGKEVLKLCTAIKADVKSKFDIDIYPEVNIK